MADVEKEEEQAENSSVQEVVIGTIDTVESDGVTIVIDGDDAAGQKKYKVNCAVRFVAGDRVKLTRNSGTYIVEYVIGTPMDRYPIPPGGTTGQVLAKSSNSDYALTWSNAGHGIPAGGNAGKYLRKTSNVDYAVEWGDAPAVSALANGSNTVSFSGSALYPSGTCSLGTNGSRFNGCYLMGSMFFGNSASKLGFFGTTPVTRQAVANNATVATLITALKTYGLFY